MSVNCFNWSSLWYTIVNDIVAANEIFIVCRVGTSLRNVCYRQFDGFKFGST